MQPSLPLSLTESADSAEAIEATEPSDAELAARVARHDRAAFEQIYDRYSAKALGLCVRILGDRRLSEDVLQESFWRAWQKASSFDPARANFATWLFSIVHHCAVDELRRLRSRGGPLIELDADDSEAHMISDPHSDVMNTVLANMQSEQVKMALVQLPSAQRAVIVLAYYGGYTRQEIAMRLHEPMGTVHTRARLGLLKLGDLLGNLTT